MKDVDLNESMIRAIARQAEAERERRAKIIHAEGELQASEKLLQAAQMLSKQPQAMQLRYLQTLANIAGDKTSTIVFPLPIDLLTALIPAARAEAPREVAPFSRSCRAGRRTAGLQIQAHAWTNVVTRRLARSRKEHSRSVSAKRFQPRQAVDPPPSGNLNRKSAGAAGSVPAAACRAVFSRSEVVDAEELEAVLAFLENRPRSTLTRWVVIS